MDCTTTGASEPTRTVPMVQVTDLRRWIKAMWKVQFNRLNLGRQLKKFAAGAASPEPDLTARAIARKMV